MRNQKRLRQRKEARCRALIYLKAWLPTITVVLLLVAMLIPCLRYTIAGTGTKEPISEATLLSNTWETTRGALFGDGKWQKTELGFAKASFYAMLVSVVLFGLSAAMSVWASVGATRYYLNPRREGKEYAVYRTFFSRPLLFGYQLLMLPLLAFPRIIVLFYQELLFYPTILNLTFPEPLIIGILLLILNLSLTLAAKKWERRMSLDVFASPKQKEEPDELENYEEPRFLSEEERQTYEMNEKVREEQMERIRKLLARDDEDQDKGTTS